MVTFEPGQNTTSLELKIRDDEVFQCDRRILVTLPTSVYSTEDMVRSDSQSTTTIIVEDNDGTYMYPHTVCIVNTVHTFVWMDIHIQLYPG